MFSLRELQWGLNETMHFQVKCLAWAQLQAASCKWMHWWNSRWWIAGMVLPTHKVRLEVARCVVIMWALNHMSSSGFPCGSQLVSAVWPSHKSLPHSGSKFHQLKNEGTQLWLLSPFWFSHSTILGAWTRDPWLHLSIHLFLQVFIESTLLPWGLKTKWIFYELNCVCSPPNLCIELLTPNLTVLGWPKIHLGFFFPYNGSSNA